MSPPSTLKTAYRKSNSRRKKDIKKEKDVGNVNRPKSAISNAEKLMQKCTENQRKKRSSYKERRVNALAPRADEGRG